MSQTYKTTIEKPYKSENRAGTTTKKRFEEYMKRYMLNRQSARTILDEHAVELVSFSVGRESEALYGDVFPDPDTINTLDDLRDIMEQETFQAWVIDFEENLVELEPGQLQAAVIKVDDSVTFEKPE